MTENMQAWFDIGKYIAGSGVAGVLAVACFKLWNSYQAELEYSKQREKEIASVFQEIYKDRDDKVYSLIQELKATIERHYDTRN